MTFDLRATVKTMSEANEDPDLVADLVMAAVPAKELRSALLPPLRHFVSSMWTSERAAVERTPLPQTPRTGQSIAVRVADWWERRLATRVQVEDGRWTTLGDCTVVDVQFLIDERYAQSRALVVAAGRYEELRDEMIAKGSRRVADVPVSVLTEVLKDAA